MRLSGLNKRIVAILLCASLLVVLLLVWWQRSPTTKPSGIKRHKEVRRCILNNDHVSLRQLLLDKENRAFVRTYEVEKAMERGNLEVIQEISKHSDTIRAIDKQGVKNAISGEHVHIVRHVLTNPTLQSIVFESDGIIEAISRNDKLMNECVTDEVMLMLLASGDDVVNSVMYNCVFGSRVSAWVIDHLMKSEDVRHTRSWSCQAWSRAKEDDLRMLMERCSTEKLVRIMECPGAADALCVKDLQFVLSTGHGRELLKIAFIKDECENLRDAVARTIKSRRNAYINLMMFLCDQEEEHQRSYKEICDLRVDSISSEVTRVVVERLNNIPVLSGINSVDVYKQLLFRRKIRAGREEFRKLPTSVIEKLHECFAGDEAETSVELAVRKLEEQHEQVPLSTHDLYMIYGEEKGRYSKSGGRIESCLRENRCVLCEEALVNKKLCEEGDSEVPTCPVCENECDSNSECSIIKYVALCCGHVYHSSCLDALKKSPEFSNECPRDFCKKPVIKNLSSQELQKIRQDNALEKMVSDIKKLTRSYCNQTRFIVSYGGQNVEMSLYDMSMSISQMYEVEELLRLMVLRVLLNGLRRTLPVAICEELERRTRYDYRNFHRLSMNYPLISMKKEYEDELERAAASFFK